MSGFHHCDKASKKIYLKEKRLILPMGSEFSVHGHLVILFLGLWEKQSIKAHCGAKTLVRKQIKRGRGKRQRGKVDHKNTL